MEEDGNIVECGCGDGLDGIEKEIAVAIGGVEARGL